MNHRIIIALLLLGAMACHSAKAQPSPAIMTLSASGNNPIATWGTLEGYNEVADPPGAPVTIYSTATAAPGSTIEASGQGFTPSEGGEAGTVASVSLQYSFVVEGPSNGVVVPIFVSVNSTITNSTDPIDGEASSSFQFSQGGISLRADTRPSQHLPTSFSTNAVVLVTSGVQYSVSSYVGASPLGDGDADATVSQQISIATNFTQTNQQYCLALSPNLIFERPTITSSGNSVIVSWPETGCYNLQQNSDLTTTNWTPSSYPISTSNNTNSITITQPTGNLFFRLSR